METILMSQFVFFFWQKNDQISCVPSFSDMTRKASICRSSLFIGFDFSNNTFGHVELGGETLDSHSSLTLTRIDWRRKTRDLLKSVKVTFICVLRLPFDAVFFRAFHIVCLRLLALQLYGFQCCHVVA